MNLDKYNKDLMFYASDILNSNGINMEKGFVQHGNTSVFEHSCTVTKFCLFLVDKFNLSVNKSVLIRGSLLHDYFLYDWHDNDKSHRLHGFTHGRKAAMNAKRDFDIGKVEYDMILCHMFPLTLRFPKYKEGIILTISDKICACYEIFNNFWSCLRRFVYSKSSFFRMNYFVIFLNKIQTKFSLLKKEL